jgi:predicted DNA-binding protein
MSTIEAHMQHTSIRLTDEHAARIKETGKGPSTVIKMALEAYFNPPPDLFELVREHERRYHVPQNEHKEGTPVPQIEHIRGTHVREDEHNGGTPVECKKEGEAIICAISTTTPKTIMAYILTELEAGREPLLPDVVDRFGTTTQTLSKTLSPYGIRAQETKRGGKAGRYFTLAMKSQIEAVLAAK